MNQNKVGPPTALILTMLLGVVGISVQENTLISSRPSTTKDFSYSYPDIENVDARLWQDPLIAIEIDIKESEKALKKDKLAKIEADIRKLKNAQTTKSKKNINININIKNIKRCQGCQGQSKFVPVWRSKSVPLGLKNIGY
jgi:hypothetical protein